MAVTRQYKEDTLGELKSIFAEAKAVSFVNFTGLTVEEITNFRAKLRSEGVGYKVAKKTLIKLAQTGKISGDMPEIPGAIAVVYSTTDELSPARLIISEKPLKEKLTIVGGIFEGAYQDQAAMTAIALIPDLHTLRGMFVNIINVPLQTFTTALFRIAETKTN